MERERGVEILRSLGLKVTSKRLEVICCLDEQPSCLSAEDVRQQLILRRISIGLPTVYRILDELAGAGIVTRIFMPGRSQQYYFCGNREHHHHFVCESCRRVEDLDRCGLEGLLDELSRRSGGRVTSHILQINGICAACAAAGEKQHDP